MRKSLTTEEFTKKAIEIHRGKYDYSLVNYINNREKVTIICKEHGEFKQTPNAHLAGQGCKICKSITLGNLFKSNTEEFVEKAKIIHGEDTYDYSLIDYKGAKTDVIIICDIHGEFTQKPEHHLAKRGCPLCGYNTRAQKLTQSTEEFIKKAKNIHNHTYDYSKVNYINAKNKVTIVCSIHGEFSQNPYSHLGGKGCPQCGIDSAIITKKVTTEEFITKARCIHGDRYRYDNVDYIHNKNKVTIICPIHNEFQQTPTNHIQGNGCPICAQNLKGWSHTNWQIAGENSKSFDNFKVYVMKFNDRDGKEFYKIGKTFRNIKQRIIGLKAYAPISTYTIGGTAKFCSKMEGMMLKALKEYKYKPISKFGGSTECFSHIPDDIFNTLKSFSNG